MTKELHPPDDHRLYFCGICAMPFENRKKEGGAVVKELRFPINRRLYFCGICAMPFENQMDAARCEQRGVAETTRFRIGDAVQIGEPDYAGKNLSPRKSTWRIKALYYTAPGETIFNFGRHDGLVDPHTLAVKLEEARPQNARIILMTQQDLLLWQEGNTKKLKAAGLLRE